MHSIKNELLTATIKSTGAELISLKSEKESSISGKETRDIGQVPRRFYFR